MPELTCRNKNIGRYGYRCGHTRRAHGDLGTSCAVCYCPIWRPGIPQRLGYVYRLLIDKAGDALRVRLRSHHPHA